MKKAEDLRTCTVEELNENYKEVCKELFLLNNELRVSRKLDKPHQLKEKKKERARILTVIREIESKGE